MCNGDPSRSQFSEAKFQSKEFSKIVSKKEFLAVQLEWPILIINSHVNRCRSFKEGFKTCQYPYQGMAPPLPPETLKEIFEYLQDDLGSLHSCVLVNRQWAQVSVEILWRDTAKFRNQHFYYRKGRKILSTLLSCLPGDSKEMLKKRGITIASSKSRPPLFDYVGMCRFLAITSFHKMVDIVTTYYNRVNNSTANRRMSNRDYGHFIGRTDEYSKYLIKQELFKMFVSRCRSLKRLEYRDEI
ncbi:18823_t:CDS:1, partial [Acaulospora morrowiae]